MFGRRLVIAGVLVLMLSPTSAIAQESEQPWIAAIEAGSCNELGEIVAELTPPRNAAGPSVGGDAARPAAVSFTAVPLGIDAILASDHAITVRQSADSDTSPSACGEIGGAPNPQGALAIMLFPDGAEAAGVAYLSPGAANPRQTDISVFVGDIARDEPAPEPPTASDDALPEAQEVEATATAEPSSESEPTATSEPIDTASGDLADAIPLTDAFVLLGYYFVDTGDDLYLFGEMQNVSGQAAMAPTADFTFYDESGNVYGTEAVSPTSYWVPAGGRMPFQTLNVLGGALRPGDWADVQVTAGTPFWALEQVTLEGLEIQGGPLEGQVGDEVQGTLLNTSPVPLGPITITVAYYDAEDRFVASCSGDYLDISIPPERSVRFDVYTTGGCGFVSAAEGFPERGEPETYRLILGRLEF